MLAEDVGFWSDGGGKVAAARRPLSGRAEVINLLLGIRRTASSYGVPPDAISFDFVDVNGEPAASLRLYGHVDSIYTCSFHNGAISALRVVRNPDKLQFIAKQMGA